MGQDDGDTPSGCGQGYSQYGDNDVPLESVNEDPDVDFTPPSASFPPVHMVSCV